jgi:ferredoxin
MNVPGGGGSPRGNVAPASAAVRLETGFAEISPEAGEIFTRGGKMAVMARSEDRNPDNAPGRYYVDTNCIDCDMCRGTAPGNFTRGEDISHVFKQPENAEEEAQCQEAMEGCPVESIGWVE